MRKFLNSVFGSRPTPKLPTHALVPVPVTRAMPEVYAPQPATMGYLDRGGNDGGSWGNPNVMPLRSSDEDVRSAWGPVTGNVRHLIQNSGWLSGAVDQFTGYAIGGGLVPNIEPAYELLGWTPERAKEWARDVEQIFADWADDPTCADERGVHTFGALQAQAMRSWFSTGDVLGIIGYDEGRGGWRTSTNVLDPVRVATPHGFQGSYSSAGITEGFEFDDKGRPIALWIAPPAGSRDHRGTRIAFWSEQGRQLVSHSFIGEAGQIRGLSPFASVVEALKQTVALSDAMLVAAHAAASVVGVVTSDLPSADVARSMVGEGGDPLQKMMEARTGWHETLADNKSNITLGKHGRVFHLSTGERFDMHAGREHYQHYPEHLKSLLREISRASGLPYEMMSLDRANATFSSGRLGLLDFWSLVEQRRKTLIEPLCRAALAGVVEEAVSRGWLSFPGGARGLRSQKSSALRSRWFGPARPSVDEMKSVRAAVERLKSGLTSLAEESAALGSDWEATQRQRAHERKTAASLKLPDTWSSTNSGGSK